MGKKKHPNTKNPSSPVSASPSSSSSLSSSSSSSSSSSAASSTRVKAKRTPEGVTDKEIQAQLDIYLKELIAHSRSCYEYAFKMSTRLGKGTLFWVLPSYKIAAEHKERVAVQYISRERAVSCEYPSVVQMIDNYDPDRTFVALVAIRTGDKRDSLMKCVTIGVDAEATFEDRKQLFPYLRYTGPPTPASDHPEFDILPCCVFCSSQLCFNIEPSRDSFKKCSRCGLKKYCSKDCQFVDWRMGHKQLCASQRTQLAKLTEMLGRFNMSSSLNESAILSTTSPSFSSSLLSSLTALSQDSSSSQIATASLSSPASSSSNSCASASSSSVSSSSASTSSNSSSPASPTS
eukprot:TRINITY_DN712_c1_g2_i1.p1 TRINITY_DN712_c1_g2~~TRINITY_DN712_c1_g2_i1.p1  ORF type:complete len:347 (-),score=106.18 TRINITY_DN712_c1_g2_i1:1-1041(-)